MSRVSTCLKGGGALCLLLAAISLQAALPPQPKAAPANMPDGDIALASAHAGAVGIPSAANAWGGARTGNEATLSDRVVNYAIQATLDPVKHTIEGREKLTWRNRSAREVRSVYLHLYLNAFESANSTFFSEKRNLSSSFRTDVDTKDGEWGHIALKKVRQGGADAAVSFVHPDGGPQTDHTVVRIDLPTPVAAGASTTLDIDFHDQLPRVIARTGYFGSFHLVGQWFPKIGVLELPGERGATAERWNVHEMHLHSEFYADYGNYDVKISVPKGYTVGATGDLQGPPQERGGMVTHHYIQGDVHDFAWTADNRTATPLEGVTKEGDGVPKVNVQVLFPPEYRSNAAPALQATLDAIAYFSKTLGPYPYKHVTVVIPPYNADEAGGMEYPGFFTTISVADVSPGTLAADSLDFVTIHEFGHDYFYGILGSNEFEEPMLDEGMNEYWDQRMLNDRGQKVPIATSFTKRIGLAVSAPPFDQVRMSAVQDSPSDGLGQNSWDRYSSGSYGTVYSRTATAMRDLEARLTKPVMARAMKQYYNSWKFRHPSIADLRETLAQASGQRAIVESVFAQQVYGTGKIDDSIVKLTSNPEYPQPGTQQVSTQGASDGQRFAWREDTEKEIDKRIDAQTAKWEEAHPDAKKGIGGPYPYRTTVTLKRMGVSVPQTLVVKFADGSMETVLWDNDQLWQRYSWVKPVKAVSAELDPQRQHFLDANKLNDSLTIKADRSASRRWASELAALVQMIFSLMVSL
jgi:hypothetical protein